MKLLELPPYYFPEQISSTHLTADLTEALTKSGYRIENYVPTPCRGISEAIRKKYAKIKYEEMYDGKVKVFRFPMVKEGRNPIGRAFRYLAIHMIQKRKGCKAENIDAVLGGSTPPIQGLLCGKVAKVLGKKQGKKVPFVYFLHDVFPDSLVTTGLARKEGILWKIGRKIENKTYAYADKIIVISEGIKANIVAKGVPEEKIEVISNWINTDAVKPIEKKDNVLFDEYKIDRHKFIVLYAGNLGAAQGTNIILEAAKELEKYNDIQFVIFGSGSGYQAFEKEINVHHLSNIILNRILPRDRVSEVYSLGDVDLITCKKGVGKSGMPSKLWSIMACNTQIIASFDTDSDLASIINQTGAGKCVEPENSEVLIKAILQVYQEWSKGGIIKGNWRDYVIDNMSKEICVKRYLEVISSVIS